MHLLAVTPYYEPEGGGLERYAHAILSRMAARGHTVDALTFTRGAPAQERRDGVRVQRRHATLRLGNTPVDLSFRRAVERMIKTRHPDVVVAHTPVPFPAQMAYAAARRRRVPFVTTYHAGRLRGSSLGLEAVAAISRATFERRMLAGSKGLIAVSPYVRDHALSEHRERVTVVPPGVDLSAFPANGGSKGHGILFVGPLDRAYRWKGVDVLWDAFEEARNGHPEATLTLIGDGDRRAEFERRARKTTGITVLGRLTQPQLARAYREACAIVLPSTTDAESFGMVLAEANACGRPVIASRVGGVPDFVRDGDNGWLARPGDAADLADKIRRILDEPDEAWRMGRNGHERVARDHDWDHLAALTEGVVEKALT